MMTLPLKWVIRGEESASEMFLSSSSPLGLSAIVPFARTCSSRSIALSLGAGRLTANWRCHLFQSSSATECCRLLPIKVCHLVYLSAAERILTFIRCIFAHELELWAQKLALIPKGLSYFGDTYKDYGSGTWAQVALNDMLQCRSNNMSFLWS